MEKKIPATILVVDDDRIILDSLGEFLRCCGYEVQAAASFHGAMQILEKRPINLVLSDINMPGGTGFELLSVVRKRHPEISIIMMTAFGTIESAVEAIKMGAFNYLTKPINDEELEIVVQRAIEQQAIVRENQSLKLRLDGRWGMESLIGHDYRMQRVYELIESVADSKVSVLIQGSSGTGKSLVAGVIHQVGERRDKPFVEVSSGAIPESLLESELFGHTRGAFTGAVAAKAGKFRAAHGGTIFLDEIGTASPALQVKLLRVLQSHQFDPVGSNKTETVDVRVILATNVNLEVEVQAGRFREDLYYRINVVTIDLPTLADRISDIPILAESFLRKFSKSSKRAISGFDEAAMQLLQRYHWPGNVRELENVVERAVVLTKNSEIGVTDLPPRILDAGTASDETSSIQNLKDALESPERQILESALRANQWNRQLTADQLGINRTTLYKKMRRLGLDREPAEIRRGPG